MAPQLNTCAPTTAVVVVPSAAKAKKAAASSSKPHSRGAGFTRTEDLLICKAWVSASCDAQHGVGQKLSVFMTTMHGNYSALLTQQERLDANRLRAAGSEPAISNDDDHVVTIAQTYDRRTPTSVFDRFRKVISPKVMKFIGIEAATPKQSGWNDDDLYNACNSAAQARFSKFGNFDDFRACKEYLEDKPKFISYVVSEEKRDQKVERPMGTKKEKKMLDNQALASSVIETMNNNNKTLDEGKTAFFNQCGSAVESMMISFKKQEEMKIVELLSTPQKEQWKKAQWELMLEELETKKASKRAKRRKFDILGSPEGTTTSSQLNATDASESGSSQLTATVLASSISGDEGADDVAMV